jgi:hypothetical protein
VQRSRYADPAFWVEACDTALSVAAKAMVATIGAEALGLTEAHWTWAFDVAALAALVSILTSIAGAKPPGQIDNASPHKRRQ